MRAMVVRKYGPPDVFEWREVPDPELKPGDALVRVRAIGINFADLLARMGIYSGTPKPPFIPGLELAGEVEQVTPAPDAPAAALKPGDRVIAMTLFRAYAEKIAVPAAQVLPIPEKISFEEAAAMPVNYLTAYHSMFFMGNLQRGDRILIHGAAGGVGVAAVQLAKARGLVAFGTASTSKQDFLRQQGVDHPMDYTREDFEKIVRRIAPDGIEMAFDPIGGKSFAKSYRCLGPTGRLVVYGFSTISGPSGRLNWLSAARAIWETPRFHPLRLIHENKAVIGVHLGRMPSKGQILRQQWDEILTLYGQGQVKPIIGKTFSLQEAAAAHTYMHTRQNIGKVLLLV